MRSKITPSRAGRPIQITDFVGSYGAYQLYLTVILFVRYILLGLMANSGPLFTPDVNFYCQLPVHEVISILPNITLLNASQQAIEIREEFNRTCQLDSLSHFAAFGIHVSNLTTRDPGRRYRECSNFTYDLHKDQGRTMTSEFNLVCDREWLRSLFQSLLSASIVVAHVFWGTFSDKYGRFNAIKLCLVISLLAGTLSIFTIDFWTFTLARAVCSFGDLGLVVSMTTIAVELVGNQFRGTSVAVVNFGYAFGVALLPYIMAYFEDFRHVLVFTVMCHLISMPLILTTSESIRWLVINKKFKSAKREIKRICGWNYRTGKCVGCSDRKTTPIEAIDYVFGKFVSQIESQNLFDPLEEEFLEPEEVTRWMKEPTSVDDDLKGVDHVEESGDGASKDTFSFNEAKSHGFEIIRAEDPRTSNDELGDLKLQSTTTKKFAKLGLSSSCGQLEHLKKLDQITSNQDLSKRATLPISRQPGQRQDMVIQFRDHWVKPSAKGQEPRCINLVANQLSFVGRVSRLFRDKELMITVFTIVYTTFNSELQYTSYIIINLEAGDDIYLNYMLGGCMEFLAALVASLLLSYAPRRASLVTFWLLISFACFGLSLAHIDSNWAVWMLALAKFSQSCLSSIASVAAYESFPTFLRQSGSGLVFTLGMLGSVLAPLIFAEFDDHAGMDRVLMTFSLSSLIGAILIYLYLRETKDQELQ